MTTHQIYTVGPAPVKITPNGTHSGMDITIQNVNASGNIYVGGANLTSVDYGYRILPNHAISFELSGMDDLYLFADNGGSQAAVLKAKLEIGQ